MVKYRKASPFQALDDALLRAPAPAPELSGATAREVVVCAFYARHMEHIAATLKSPQSPQAAGSDLQLQLNRPGCVSYQVMRFLGALLDAMQLKQTGQPLPPGSLLGVQSRHIQQQQQQQQTPLGPGLRQLPVETILQLAAVLSGQPPQPPQPQQHYAPGVHNPVPGSSTAERQQALLHLLELVNQQEENMGLYPAADNLDDDFEL